MEIKAKKRDEIPAEYKWDLTLLYKTDADWRKAVEEVKADIEAMGEFEGTLTTGKAIAACLDKYYAACETESRMYLYAGLKKCEDGNVSESQAMADTADGLESDFEEATAFISPEILENDEEAIRNFIKTTPELKMYEHYLENLLREKPHVLSVEMEELLASASEMADTADNAYTMLCDTDLKFGNITDEDGNTVEVTEGRYYKFMCSPDRRVRKDAYDALNTSYAYLKNTIASLYSSSVKKDIFFAKARKHKSTLDASLFESNIPHNVYENLIKTVHEFLPVLHKYYAVRKKALNLDTLHMYDKYAPLVADAEMKISFEQAKKMLIEGLAPLGEQYLADMAKGMESGWLDVYENEGKTGGAFEWAGLNTPPYVLMNYEDNLDGLTGHLAHEMGHAMHDFYTNANQPNVYCDYPVFTSEVASTVHETIMIEHLLKIASCQKTKIWLIDKFIEQFIGTVFRQTMFAEFEMLVHSMAEDDEPLVLESLNKIYRELSEKYHGAAMVIDEPIENEWARIPHFYRAFYVYQYSTGYAAALAFTKRLQSGNPQAREDYLSFLKSGANDYPIEILKKAGVDMSTPTPIREALSVFEGLVDELEKYFA